MIGACADRRPIEARYARAGVPHAIYGDDPTPSSERSGWDSAIGLLVHRAIGQIAPAAQVANLAARVQISRDAVGAALSGFPNLGRQDKASVRVLGMVNAYLRLYLPSQRTTFLGAELPAGAGRTDLAWSHPNVGVFFDEIKTWRHHSPTLDESAHDQIARYFEWGITLYGDQFAGVRLLTLGNHSGSLAVTREGTLEPLMESALSPISLDLDKGVI